MRMIGVASCAVVACFGVSVVVAPSRAPTPGAVTDITWDPFTGTLWACDTLGWVTNIDPATGNIAPGGLVPLGSPLDPSPPCGLSAPPTGIAFDTASPAGSPTFYAPQSCWTPVGAQR